MIKRDMRKDNLSVKAFEIQWSKYIQTTPKLSSLKQLTLSHYYVLYIQITPKLSLKQQTSSHDYAMYIQITPKLSSLR